MKPIRRASIGTASTWRRRSRGCHSTVDGFGLSHFGEFVFLLIETANGDKHVGEWKDGKEHGQGTATYADGNKYVGEYRNDKRHGQGTFTFADGTKYVGKWKNDLPNELGVRTYADGRVEEGLFENGKFKYAQKS